jgi:hypothetical protein
VRSSARQIALNCASSTIIITTCPSAVRQVRWMLVAVSMPFGCSSTGGTTRGRARRAARTRRRRRASARRRAGRVPCASRANSAAITADAAAKPLALSAAIPRTSAARRACPGSA